MPDAPAPNTDLAYADTLWKSADALRGQIPGVSGRASARAKLVIDRKRLGAAPRSDDGPAALAACQVDTDCTIYFRTSACVPTDPIAVATAPKWSQTAASQPCSAPTGM